MLKAFYQDILVEAGCDEAGRGCFAGPVFAAAVILSGDFSHPVLNDSKMMTAAARVTLWGALAMALTAGVGALLGVAA